jgi:hypothetical protein
MSNQAPRCLRDARHEHWPELESFRRAEWVRSEPEPNRALINGIALLPVLMMAAGFLIMVAVYWDQIKWR